MSFWPFGQTSPHSDIDKILEQYLAVLHRLEREDVQIPSVFKASLEGKRVREDKRKSSAHKKQRKPDEHEHDQNEHENEIKDVPLSRSKDLRNNNENDHDNDSDNNDVDSDSIGSGHVDSNGFTTTTTNARNSSEEEDEDEDDEEEDETNGDMISSDSGSSTSSGSNSSDEISSSSNSSSSQSTTSMNLKDATEPIVPDMSLQKLDNSFIDRMLRESELLNELAAQNKSLLDFICFGFFFKDGDGERVENIQYLLDQLVFCVDQFKIEDIDDDFDGKAVSSRGSSPMLEDDRSMDFNKIISESPEDEDEYLSRANLISDVLSLDIWLITESIVKNKTYLERIWFLLKHKNFAYERSPLIPIFLKVNQNLLLTRQDQYLNFIRSQKDLVDLMLKHVDIALLMDFFLKLISTDKIESPTGVIELVSDQKLIDKLLDFLNNKLYSPDIQACVCDFLKALIVISANAPLDELSIGPNSLTRRLASPKCIDRMIKVIFEERGAALNTTISIVIELIRKNNSDYDQINLLDTTVESHPPSDRDPIFLGYLLRRFATHLPKLFEIIDDINDTNDSEHMLTNQMNEEFIPIGFERFKIVELIAELLHCSNMGLLNTKRAERIARVRDQVRKRITFQLQDALNELTITPEPSKSSTSSIDNKVDDGKTDNDNDSSEDEFLNVNTDENDEIDETFDIPYINEEQNNKLRTNPTIGDLFKINLYDSQIIPKIMSLFLNHPWNNFWHNVIFDIIQQIFNGRMDFSYNSFLVFSLFNLKGSFMYMPEEASVAAKLRDFKITKDFILEGYQHSYKFYEKKNTNLGYMGHLVLIAEEVVKFSKLYKVELISPDIQDCLQESDWQYYSEEVLNHTRLMYSKILGGGNFVEDGNGNIIPQINDGSYLGYDEESDESGGKLINVENLEEQLSLSTESDLHTKLRDMLIMKAQQDVDNQNSAKGVIILGPPYDDQDGNEETQ
ncbi:Uncharacterized protein RNJ44_00468 [Nakaseomyces bracarensis]|uniref:Uncharacterized protein n=1 Tax=Nakaseomyces bracarensis TaxID=273131 RepID=A0ABR4NSN0_9SACH